MTRFLRGPRDATRRHRRTILARSAVNFTLVPSDARVNEKAVLNWVATGAPSRWRSVARHARCSVRPVPAIRRPDVAETGAECGEIVLYAAASGATVTYS